ncbi:hypothetical protein UFOVP257_157 [uncultured Caudovirales phage]|uniref:Uncharacterized protein n=1 Tax=uncultured Caudovirales phage TaxID=2100421 RepID=A0A6J5LJW5_9CAUD|nr:hypothetical protein UFOVP257_157 [uncultured Caudovirales phage]
MLVSKKYDESDIVSFRLVNGDEIVARIVSEDDNNFKLERPCTVLPSQQGIGLMQSMFTADPDLKVTVSKQHVIMHSPTIDAMQKHYLKTTTGIEPITRGSIIT